MVRDVTSLKIFRTRMRMPIRDGGRMNSLPRRWERRGREREPLEPLPLFYDSGDMRLRLKEFHLLALWRFLFPAALYRPTVSIIFTRENLFENGFSFF